MTAHERYMKVAFELARKGEGLTRPNPPVGAVLVKNKKIVGAGYHKKAGGHHAEIYALKQAGLKVNGATLYVTLEPCSTFGKTPPCTQAVLSAGIARVVVSTNDPNPLHAGKGLTQLRKHGVEVIEHCCREEGDALLVPFKKWITTGLPYITLKLALTIDGKIADSKGASKWITGSEARAAVQALRRRADAILIGSQTAVTDNPSLLPRPRYRRKPYRIVVDSRARIPLTSTLLNDADVENTIIATTKYSSETSRKRVLNKGAKIWVLPFSSSRISLSTLFRKIGGKGLLHILCEGGGQLAASLIQGGWVDEYNLFIAPRVFGKGVVGVEASEGWLLDVAPKLNFVEVKKMGEDVYIRARPQP
ncbi:MAG: bifunctional diaminohydroxyphosphoribosylaminopyrimidine deaminase/5-amino-6-(5-phosphoribosylamino)uracil reductase RibD [Kiritimatiellae bacterium]|nr:bifunctional diaminohydroxyphosphoribosylaminopyrimidine deaminase/5-amino-6-(5-phosphoribosylamino)uracil reductase RibD [Kiritimatiellia bacterium]